MPEERQEEWVYLGQERNEGIYLWRDPEGVTLRYKRLKARVFGGIYRIAVTRREEKILVNPDVSFTGKMADDAAAIQAKALASEVQLKTIRLERNTSRTQDLDEALEPLLDIVRKLKNYGDRAAILEYITRKVYAS